MTDIVARWEWRHFAQEFGQAQARIEAAGEPFTRQSSEIYIISKLSGDNTKIRDELMDIKTLQRIGDHQLEQWFPVMKSGFPLPRTELEKVCSSWKVQLPKWAGQEMPYGQFIEQLVAEHEDLRPVAVEKLRHGYQLDQAMVELAELKIDGQSIKTVCVEHADPALVWRLVNELGLAEYENVNYLKAIKRQLGWPT